MALLIFFIFDQFMEKIHKWHDETVFCILGFLKCIKLRQMEEFNNGQNTGNVAQCSAEGAGFRVYMLHSTEGGRRSWGGSSGPPARPWPWRAAGSGCSLWPQITCFPENGC